MKQQSRFEHDRLSSTRQLARGQPNRDMTAAPCCACHPAGQFDSVSPVPSALRRTAVPLRESNWLTYCWLGLDRPLSAGQWHCPWPAVALSSACRECASGNPMPSGLDKGCRGAYCASSHSRLGLARPGRRVTRFGPNTPTTRICPPLRRGRIGPLRADVALPLAALSRARRAPCPVAGDYENMRRTTFSTDPAHTSRRPVVPVRERAPAHGEAIENSTLRMANTRPVHEAGPRTALSRRSGENPGRNRKG